MLVRAQAGAHMRGSHRCFSLSLPFSLKSMGMCPEVRIKKKKWNQRKVGDEGSTPSCEHDVSVSVSVRVYECVCVNMHV